MHNFRWLKLSMAMIMLVSLVSLSVCGPVQAAPARLLSGSSSTSSSHYVYAVAASKSINEVCSDTLNVTTVATGGAVDNLERIDQIRNRYREDPLPA